MVRALSKGDISMNFNELFNETERFSILSGMGGFVLAIGIAAIGISHIWYKWIVSIVIVCVSVYLLFLFNYKKYNMVKGKTRGRLSLMGYVLLLDSCMCGLSCISPILSHGKHL